MTKRLLKIGKTIIALSLFLTMGNVAMAADETTDSEKTVISAETKMSEETETTMTSKTVSSVEESSDETIESETAQTEDSQPTTDLSISEEEVKEIIDRVDTLIEEQVGKQTDKVMLEDMEYSANYIREILEKDDYGITKDALDKYTDRQLEDTMLLFQRYNSDVTGMDFGSYVRLLNALYVDQTISVEEALAQLSFNPSSFSSFGDMIAEIDRLQVYLSILYPPNSTFIAIEKMTNDQLIEVLQNLDKFEKQYMVNDEYLPAGRVILIANEYNRLMNQTNDSSTDSKKENEIPLDNTQKDDKNKDDKKENGLRLPQTGEGKAKLALSIIGILVIISGILLLIKRNKGMRQN